MSRRDDRQYRAIGHKLRPVVTVAARGLTDTVVAEIDRALTDHELIKVKVAVGDKRHREAVADEICARTGAALLQATGSMLLLLRRSPEPDPRLSNLLRYRT